MSEQEELARLRQENAALRTKQDENQRGFALEAQDFRRQITALRARVAELEALCAKAAAYELHLTQRCMSLEGQPVRAALESATEQISDAAILGELGRSSCPHVLAHVAEYRHRQRHGGPHWSVKDMLLQLAKHLVFRTNSLANELTLRMTREALTVRHDELGRVLTSEPAAQRLGAEQMREAASQAASGESLACPESPVLRARIAADIRALPLPGEQPSAWGGAVPSMGGATIEELLRSVGRKPSVDAEKEYPFCVRTDDPVTAILSADFPVYTHDSCKTANFLQPGDVLPVNNSVERVVTEVVHDIFSNKVTLTWSQRKPKKAEALLIFDEATSIDPVVWEACKEMWQHGRACIENIYAPTDSVAATVHVTTPLTASPGGVYIDDLAQPTCPDWKRDALGIGDDEPPSASKAAPPACPTCKGERKIWPRGILGYPEPCPDCGGEP